MKDLRKIQNRNFYLKQSKDLRKKRMNVREEKKRII